MPSKPRNHGKLKGKNYAASKAGNWFLGTELDKRVRKDGVVSVTQSPGTLNTKGWDAVPLMKFLSRPFMHDPIFGAYTECKSNSFVYLLTSTKLTRRCQCGADSAQMSRLKMEESLPFPGEDGKDFLSDSQLIFRPETAIEELGSQAVAQRFESARFLPRRCSLSRFSEFDSNLMTGIRTQTSFVSRVSNRRKKGELVLPPNSGIGVTRKQKPTLHLDHDTMSNTFFRLLTNRDFRICRLASFIKLFHYQSYLPK